MCNEEISDTIKEHISKLEDALEKCKKGILKIDHAKQLIDIIRANLSDQLTDYSDAFELYNRFKSESLLWWDADIEYANKSDCNIIENELKMLGKIIEELNPSSMPNSQSQKEQTHFKQGEQAKAHMFIFDIMKKAINSLVITDQYLDDSIYTQITSLDKDINFRILTNEIHLKPIFLEIASKLVAEDWKIEIKSSNRFHNRYIIIDNNEIWDLGTSIKDAGGKDFTISEIKDKAAKESIKESFDNAWDDSITLISGPELNVIEYRVDLQFPVYIQNINEDQAKTDAKKQGDEWINKVENKLGVKLKISSADSDLIKGTFSTIDDLDIEISWKFKGHANGKDFIASDIILKTPNNNVLNRIIDAGNYPYWAIYYRLDSELDLNIIQKEMNDRTGDSGWIGASSKDANGNINSETLEYRNLDLLIQIHTGKSAQYQIILSYLKGGLSRGFKKAHKVFTPNKILSLLYGEHSPIEFKKLVDKAS